MSVIIIVYNGEAFLDDAIASVCAQTDKHWELIVVDDGSTDRTASIVTDRIAQFGPGIHLVRHDPPGNYGMSRARNRGLAFARGDFICFLDADDAWTPETLEVMRSGFSDDVMAVASRGQVWRPGTAAPMGETREPGVPLDAVLDPPRFARHFLTSLDSAPGLQGMMIRRSFFERHGGFHDPRRGMLEDFPFYAKLWLHHRVRMLSRVLWYYRVHPESCTAQSARNFAGMLADIQSYYYWLVGYVAGRRDTRWFLPTALALLARTMIARARMAVGGRLRGGTASA